MPTLSTVPRTLDEERQAMIAQATAEQAVSAGLAVFAAATRYAPQPSFRVQSTVVYSTNTGR